MTTNLHRPVILAAAIVGLAAGCTTRPDAKDNWQDPFFPVHHEVAPTRAIFERSAEAGAAEDGMLYPIHFDGSRVNSLGDTKLRAMIAGRPAGVPMHVYLNQPISTTRPADVQGRTSGDAVADARRDAVARRLAELGVAPGDAVVSVGPNEFTSYPADPGVRAISPATPAGAPAGGGAPTAAAH